MHTLYFVVNLAEGFTTMINFCFCLISLFVAVLVDNFQLTLADAEIQKQKEAMEEQEAQKKFEDMKKEGIEENIKEGDISYLVNY